MRAHYFLSISELCIDVQVEFKITLNSGLKSIRHTHLVFTAYGSASIKNLDFQLLLVDWE